MTGFRGTRQGSVQTGYFDQPLAGLPGQIAFLPDVNLVDSFPVNNAAGIQPGLGVVRGGNIDLAADTYSNQSAPYSITLPSATSTDTQFVGIAVRDSAMPNDADGNPVWPNDVMAPVLREGRIFVTAVAAVTPGAGVYMYIGGTGNIVGSFTTASAEISGELINIEEAVWYRAADAGATDAIIEILVR